MPTPAEGVAAGGGEALTMGAEGGAGAAAAGASPAPAGVGAILGRVMAFTGQFLTHSSHSTHFSDLLATAFRLTRSNTLVGHTRTQLPQPVHRAGLTVTCMVPISAIVEPLSATGRKAARTPEWDWRSPSPVS